MSSVSKARCINHPDKISRTRGLCGNCYGKWLRENVPGYKERQRASHRTWYRLNKAAAADYWRSVYTGEKAALIRKNATSRWATLSSEDRWAKNIKSAYGIKPDDYYSLLREQGGVCLVCEKAPESDKKFQIDHCHATGEVRGILCGRCNTLIGKMENISLNVLSRAVRYVHESTKWVENAKVS